MSMRRSLIYLILALFLALVIQPNLGQTLRSGDNPSPTNTENDSVVTNDMTYLNDNMSKYTICIDAAQTNENAESDINLELAKVIGEKFENAGYNVVYTREETETLSNDERVKLAKTNNADYLICINTTYSVDPTQRGYSIMTQEDSELIKISSTMSNELESINFSVFEGLDSDHYAEIPILKDTTQKSMEINLGYVSNSQDWNEITNESYQETICRCHCSLICRTYKIEKRNKWKKTKYSKATSFPLPNTKTEHGFEM